ncbi:hypothetical protein DD238_007970 [Peronospora effusa]|uniref:Uncharacterized protein n=1 Tax=Peronospora effusa TaxID=542832 RepID=A0A3M6V7T3_9STRA|nr:hypothetical protein DD238_007970 [Peronospora effusa]RQM12657.1 hypothetical protein DD237_007721 [Peronospora effusa]
MKAYYAKIRLYPRRRRGLLPILLYNCGTWALNDFVLHSIETFSSQHLRKVIGVRYPATISNAKLYARTETQPLQCHLLRS